MKVKALIAKLQKMDPERIVVMARDEEGNGSFMPLQTVEAGSFNRNRGEYGLEALTPKAEAQGYGEDDVVAGKPCVCLWP